MIQQTGFPITLSTGEHVFVPYVTLATTEQMIKLRARIRESFRGDSVPASFQLAAEEHERRKALFEAQITNEDLDGAKKTATALEGSTQKIEAMIQGRPVQSDIAVSNAQLAFDLLDSRIDARSVLKDTPNCPGLNRDTFVLSNEDALRIIRAAIGMEELEDPFSGNESGALQSPSSEEQGSAATNEELAL